MTIPVAVLLGFAAWTILVLMLGVGLDRWSKILPRRAKLVDFRADEPHGSDRYRRAMRAHANCIENLPLLTAVVVAMMAAGLTSPVLDVLAIILLAARVVQSSVHVIPHRLTNTWVGIRFTFFFLQLVCLVWMGIYIVTHAR